MNEQKLHIIKASYNQFRQLGFKNVTMDDLARQIGISKKTLYEQFENKDELVLESIKFMLENNRIETDAALKSSKNAIEQLISLITIMEKMLRGLNLVSYMDLQRYYPAAYQYLEAFKREHMLTDIIENLKQGITEGLYRNDVNIEVVSRFRLESAMIVFHNNVYPQDKFNIVEVNNELFVHYMYGIASIKGHKLIDKYLNKETEKCFIPNLFKVKC